MPDFFLDIFREGDAQPRMVFVQAAAAGHQQRHRVPHMVERLGEEGDVALEGHLTLQAALDDGRRQQPVAGRLGQPLQFGKEAHGGFLGSVWKGQAERAGQGAGLRSTTKKF